MTSVGCDVLWDEDPLPVPFPERPTDKPDVLWWRAKSARKLRGEEDAIEESIRRRCPVTR